MGQISWDLVLLFHARESPASASLGLVLQACANIPGFSSLNSRLEIPIHWSVTDFLTCLHYPTVYSALTETVNDSGVTSQSSGCPRRMNNDFLSPGHYLPPSSYLNISVVLHWGLEAWDSTTWRKLVFSNANTNASGLQSCEIHPHIHSIYISRMYQNSLWISLSCFWLLQRFQSSPKSYCHITFEVEYTSVTTRVWVLWISDRSDSQTQ